MNKIFIHNPFFRLISGTVVGVMVYLLILLVNNNLSNLETIFNNQELYVSILLSYLCFELMRWLISLLTRSKKPQNQPSPVVQTVVVVILSMIAIGSAISAYYKFLVGFSIGQHELNLFLTIYGFVSVLYNVLYYSQYYLQRENKERIEQETKLREKMDADFFSFRNDINPDLLYESLENLILTIHNDTNLAEEQIDYLAGVYRYTLVNRHKELVTFQEEFSSARNLVALLNCKIEGGVKLKEVDGGVSDGYLIPGSLLVTIDSIVRNTLISKKHPLTLSLYVEDDYLVLQHQLNDKLIAHHDSMNSFKRLQRSYSFFSDKIFVQVKAGNQNYIKFPIVNVPSLKEETI
jgi:hypothetical protein